MRTARWLGELREQGYRVHLVYVWVPDPGECVARVAARVRRGGHAIPDQTILRRHTRSRRNFMRTYLPLADHWRVYQNTAREGPGLAAYRLPQHAPTILDEDAWGALSGQAPAP